MGARFRSWWQYIRKHWIAILIAAIILVVAIALIIVGYRFDWTGFNGNNKSGKTLWDWLQLLIIPVVLAIGGYLFTFTISSNERKAADRHNRTEREVAEDNQREAALQAYIDKMSELLMHEKLRESKPEDEVRNIARVRTLTVLPRLDSKRKRSVLQFLHESDLIEKDNNIIALSDADLSHAQLDFFQLSGTNLSQVRLFEADLSLTNLCDAVLERANLEGANLYNAGMANANLTQANLRKANLSYAIPTNANLSYADLRGANLSQTKLPYSNLYQANLEGANLEGAVLFTAIGANIAGQTNLREANLSGTNLLGADITDEQLNQAKSLKGATMPDGSIHP